MCDARSRSKEVDRGLLQVLRCLPLFCFYQRLQSVEIGVQLFLELLADHLHRTRQNLVPEETVAG